MGVPALFRWLSRKYPKIVQSVLEEGTPDCSDGIDVPVNWEKPNPNGETDILYLDMNGIVHPCTHPEGRPPPANEQEMMLEVFKYTNRVINMVRPRRLLFIAIDGVAPRAKMNQQRSRRFRAAQEATLKNLETTKAIEEMKANGLHIDERVNGKLTWDSNAITPGTPFMDRLSESLRFWISMKLNSDPGWANLQIILSDASVPGEGEHKIMEFVRSQRADPAHDPNTRHVMYGLDADLIMLGLATHEPHFSVLREDVFFKDSQARTCRTCGQVGHLADQCNGQFMIQSQNDPNLVKTISKPFIWLRVNILREYLEVEMYVPGMDFAFDIERVLDDWVFMCFFVGNDFLPHLPSLDIHEGAIDTLIRIWKKNLIHMNGYVTCDGRVNLERAQIVLNALAQEEDKVFQRRKDEEHRRAQRQRSRTNRRESDDSALATGDYNTSPTLPCNGSAQHIAQPVAQRTPEQNSNYDPLQLIALKPTAGGSVYTANTSSVQMQQSNRAALAQRQTLKMANEANKAAAEMFRSQLLSSTSAVSSTPTKSQVSLTNASTTSAVSVIAQKRKIGQLESPAVSSLESSHSKLRPDSASDSFEDEYIDTVRLWEPGYKERYYSQKFDVAEDDYEFRAKVAQDYVRGLCWVLLYYYQGCPSWTWYYPHHYAPFASDFENIASHKVQFDQGTPWKPFEQLMGVLPAASKNLLPETLQTLMTETESEILDFYPEKFPVDLNGKRFAWQGVTLLPFIDEQRLLRVVEKQYDQLNEQERQRNSHGTDYLFVSEKAPLYNILADAFYSKNSKSDRIELNPAKSKNLLGCVSKDEECLPHASVVNPLDIGNFEEIPDDCSLSVRYYIPKSKNVHKSMLLRGVRLPNRVLTAADANSRWLN